MTGSDDASEGGKKEPAGAGSRPSEAELSARLDRLNSSLGEVRSKAGTPAPATGQDPATRSGLALAFRLGAEFVSGVLVGSLIGYGIDRFFSIAPWGMIVFTLVGFGAGVMNMLRASGEGRNRGKPGA